MLMNESVDPVRIRRRWPEHGPVERIRKRLVDVEGGRYVIPSKFSVEFYGRDGTTTPDVKITVEVDDSGGLVPVEMTVKGALAAVVVNGVPVRELAYVAAAEAAWVRDVERPSEYRPPASEDQSLAALADIRRSLRPRRKITNEHLREVAVVYQAAVRDGDPAPVRAVEREFGVARATAAGWVKQARRAGFLAATTQGKVST